MSYWKKLPAAAKYFGVSPSTLRIWIEKDGFPHKKMGTRTILINIEDADAWMRGEDKETVRTKSDQVLSEWLQ